MIENNELTALTLGLIVLFLLYLSRNDVKLIPNPEIIFLSFICRLVSLIMTNIEEIYAYDIMNLMEHSFITLSAIILLYWCWVTFKETTEVAK